MPGWVTFGRTQYACTVGFPTQCPGKRGWRQKRQNGAGIGYGISAADRSGASHTDPADGDSCVNGQDVPVWVNGSFLTTGVVIENVLITMLNFSVARSDISGETLRSGHNKDLIIKIRKINK